MIKDNEGARIALLADCPYCEGEGTDPESLLGFCQFCYGRGRVARFLAERTLERWARRDGADGDDQGRNRGRGGLARIHRGTSPQQQAS